jgi:hypothetical protein
MKKVYFIAFVNFLLHLALLSGTEALAKTYTTTFAVTENPISEGGNWLNGQANGLLWANCMTTNNFVWGNDNRGVAFADPTAILTGTWGSNQTVTATVKAINQPTGNGCCSEIELRLRSLITANTNRGYEVLFSTYTGNDYVQIVVWHGPRGVQGVGFDYINATSGHGAPVNGDVVSASISNATIRVYKNGTLILTGTDSEWSSGNPGVGFYGDTRANVGFSNFTASDGLDTPPAIATPPQSQAVNVTSNATFTVTATGSTPLSYQWYFNTTNVMVGDTNKQIVLTNVQDSDAGWYRVRVSNPAGSTLSDNAQLVVNKKPAPPTDLRIVP